MVKIAGAQRKEDHTRARVIIAGINTLEHADTT
jgi:hypothetical protein